MAAESQLSKAQTASLGVVKARRAQGTPGSEAAHHSSNRWEPTAHCHLRRVRGQDSSPKAGPDITETEGMSHQCGRRLNNQWLACSAQSPPFAVLEVVFRASLRLTTQAVSGSRLFSKREQTKKHELCRESRWEGRSGLSLARVCGGA